MYCIITLRSAVTWNTQLPLHVLMQKLTAKRVMPADAYWDEPDAGAARPLTWAEQAHLRGYEGLPTHHRMSQAKVWDLHQSAERPRGSCVDGSLPCSTTHCGSMYHRTLKMFLSPRMLLRAMGHGSDQHCADAAGRDALDVRATRGTKLQEMAGNAMHVPCVGACLMIVALHIRRM